MMEGFVLSLFVTHVSLFWCLGRLCFVIVAFPVFLHIFLFTWIQEKQTKKQRITEPQAVKHPSIGLTGALFIWHLSLIIPALFDWNYSSYYSH